MPADKEWSEYCRWAEKHCPAADKREGGHNAPIGDNEKDWSDYCRWAEKHLA